jgi:hypothetical protein
MRVGEEKLWYPIPLGYETVISGGQYRLRSLRGERDSQIDPGNIYTLVLCVLCVLSMVRLYLYFVCIEFGLCQWSVFKERYKR